MSKKHDESKDLRLIGRVCTVDYPTNTISASKAKTIGIRTWGRIDYLTHYCGWHFMWNNTPIVVRPNVNVESDEDGTLPARRKVHRVPKMRANGNNSNK